MGYNWAAYEKEIVERAVLLETPYVRRKMDLDVAPGSTITITVDPRADKKQQRKQKMRDSLIGIIAALAVIVGTSALSWRKRIITALVAGTLAVIVSLLIPGCMSTTSIDGKEYSWRLDILAPIGATVPVPEWEAPAPVVIYSGQEPTSQPTSK